MTAVATVHVATTLYMAGLVWFVQVVHYPLMARVGEADFRAYATAHATRTSWVVVVPMILEAATAAWLATQPPTAGSRPLMWLGLALVVVVWMSTFWLQVPCHRLLSRGFDRTVHRRLVRTNWLRTATWTARSPIAIAALLAS